MTTTLDMTNGPGQLELGLDGMAVQPRPAASKPGPNRAAWWFQQMHRVVHEALDWRPTPPPRPQQEWLPQMSNQWQAAH